MHVIWNFFFGIVSRFCKNKPLLDLSLYISFILYLYCMYSKITVFMAFHVLCENINKMSVCILLTIMFPQIVTGAFIQYHMLYTSQLQIEACCLCCSEFPAKSLYASQGTEHHCIHIHVYLNRGQPLNEPLTTFMVSKVS